MVDTQEQYFATLGGDEYFRRNLAGQEVALTDHPALEFLMATSGSEFPAKGRAAVLGGAGGREAAGLKERLPDWKISNVDISPEAIAFGRQTFPHLEHHCLSISSVAPRLSEVLGEMDVIIVVGVLLWVDRTGLSRAIANIDESLRDGGLLVIWDFLPPTRRMNPIRHAPNHFTYKQDYGEPFLSLGTYETVALSTRTAEQPAEIDAQERRLATHLLRKNLTGLYPVGYSG